MIKIENLSKKYDKENVLENLNCTIKDGCIYGLVGANGSGKSTLLRLINGIFTPDKGIICVDGEDVIDNAEIKQDMVFVPDDLFFYPFSQPRFPTLWRNPSHRCHCPNHDQY